MLRLQQVDSPHSLARFCAGLRGTPLAAANVIEHAANAHWLALDDSGHLRARCSIWWDAVPHYPGQRLGLVGHYSASDSLAAAELLAHACRELANHSCTMAIGPMDGNTWRNYRLITDRSREPVFFLESDNPDDFPAQFVAAGFAPFVHYFSTLIPDLNAANGRDPAPRVPAMGIEMRPIEMRNFDAELRTIHRIATAGYRDNFLYTPLKETEFLRRYRALAPHVRPEFVWFAEQEGVPIGFIFAVPDILQRSRTSVIDTVILKTLCVLPAHKGKGLGSALVDCVYRAAKRLGCRRAIHALMHEDNVSRRIHAAEAQIIRRYALFARRLRGPHEPC